MTVRQEGWDRHRRAAREAYRVVVPGQTASTTHKGPTSARFAAERLATQLRLPIVVWTVLTNQPFLTALPPREK